MSYDWCNPYGKPVSHTHNSSPWQWNWTAVFCPGEHYLSRWLLTLLFQRFEKFTSKRCFVPGSPYWVLLGRRHSSVKLLLAINPRLVLSISRQDVFGTLSRSNPVFWEHKSAERAVTVDENTAQCAFPEKSKTNGFRTPGEQDYGSNSSTWKWLVSLKVHFLELTSGCHCHGIELDARTRLVSSTETLWLTIAFSSLQGPSGGRQESGDGVG